MLDLAKVPVESGPRTLPPPSAADQAGTMRGRNYGRITPIEAPRPKLPQVVVSAAAADALAGLRRDRGPQVIVLGSTSATIGIAQVRDQGEFYPDDDDVQLGTVANCCVYADISYVEPCRHDVLVLDLRTNRAGDRPAFITRPESEAERQQRVFSAQARQHVPARRGAAPYQPSSAARSGTARYSSRGGRT